MRRLLSDGAVELQPGDTARQRFGALPGFLGTDTERGDLGIQPLGGRGGRAEDGDVIAMPPVRPSSPAPTGNEP